MTETLHNLIVISCIGAWAFVILKLIFGNITLIMDRQVVKKQHAIEAIFKELRSLVDFFTEELAEMKGPKHE